MSTAAPWLSHYDSDVPPTLEPYPQRTLIDYLAETARTQPKRPALLFKGATMTYAELDRLSDCCAAAFAAIGVKRGDRVGLLLPNCPQFFIAQFGAWKLGAIVAPLNPVYTEHELEGPIREYGIETIVTLTRFYARVKALQPRTGLRRVVATNIKEYFPALLRVLFTVAREKREGDRVRLKAGDHDFAHLLLVNRHRRGPATKVSPSDPAVLLMSGGTTGTPKGALGSHEAYVRAGLQGKAWNVAAVKGTGDVLFLPLPMFHVYANVGVQALGLVSGARTGNRPEPARPARSGGDDQAGEADVFQRCADALHRAAESPGGAEGKGRLSSRSASASPGRRRCWPRPRTGSKHSPAAAWSRAIR